MFFGGRLQRMVDQQAERIASLEEENRKARGENDVLARRLAQAETNAYAARQCELFGGLFRNMQSFATRGF